ncbi:Heat shock protein 70 B2 [Lucilia cuprina]|nr:Heat shock protein 70 B2 [Lucilia cuprina]
MFWLVDVALSLGIENCWFGGNVQRIIERKHAFHANKTNLLHLVRIINLRVSIQVFEGERVMTKDTTNWAHLISRAFHQLLRGGATN